MEEIKKDIEKAVLFTLSPFANTELIAQIKNWNYVIDFLYSRKLAGRFYRQLKQTSYLSQIPSFIEEKLEQIYHFFAIKNQLYLNELEKVWKALEQEKIFLLVLKGTSLLLKKFYQLGERYQIDIDFFVADGDREKIRQILKPLRYFPVYHSDHSWWSEDHYVLGEGGVRDVFMVSLEFHWDFKPLNQKFNQDLKELFKANWDWVDFKGNKYRVPSSELQFYQSAIHGCAYHPFDSAYFWSTLLDLSVILAKEKLDYDFIIEVAKKHSLSEQLAIIFYILWQKLGLGEELWQKISHQIKIKNIVQKTSELLWQVFLSPYPISFANISLVLSKSSLKEKLKAISELLGVSSGVGVAVSEKKLTVKRPSVIEKLKNRTRVLTKDFIKLSINIARLYRKTGFKPIP